MNVGSRIKILRDEKDVTQEELGKHLGVRRSAVANYESGNRQVDIKTCERIAEYFGVSIDFLIGNVKDNPIDFLYNAKAFFSSDSVTDNEKDFALKRIIDCYFNSKSIR